MEQQGKAAEDQNDEEKDRQGADQMSAAVFKEQFTGVSVPDECQIEKKDDDRYQPDAACGVVQIFLAQSDMGTDKQRRRKPDPGLPGAPQLCCAEDPEHTADEGGKGRPQIADGVDLVGIQLIPDFRHEERRQKRYGGNTGDNGTCADEKVPGALVETFRIPAVVHHAHGSLRCGGKEFHFKDAVAEDQTEKSVSCFVDNGSGRRQHDPAALTQKVVPPAAQTQGHQLKQQRRNKKTTEKAQDDP